MAVFKIRSPEIFLVGFIQISAAGKIVGTEKNFLKQNVPQTVGRYLPALPFFRNKS